MYTLFEEKPSPGYWLHIDPAAVIMGRTCYGPYPCVEAAREACREAITGGYVNLTDDVRDFLEGEDPVIIKTHSVHLRGRTE